MVRAKFFAGGCALVGAFAAGFLLSSVVIAQSPLAPPREVLRDALNGLEGQEIIVQDATLPAGGVIPWHYHPDGHEISFVIEGSSTLEIEGQAPRQVSAGEAFHIQPGVVHRGINDSGAPARVLFVRIKPKDKPLLVPVQR